MKHTLLLFVCIVLFVIVLPGNSNLKTPPKVWGDFRIGLVNDNTAKINQRMKQAVKEGIKLNYRYRYINGGFDSTKNAMSEMFNNQIDYVKQSDSLAGVKVSFVIYLLQEEGGSTATMANVKDVTKMKKYFAIIRSAATRCKGMQSIFIIEPDTWGYLMQDGHMDPDAIASCMSQVAQEFTWLSGLPNTLSGVAQGAIRTIHQFAPDAFVGVLASHWSVIGPGWHQDGLVWAQDTAINESIRKNVMWFNKLLGSGTDRGDFIGVEKNGWSAGKWKATQNTSRWYWGDPQMKNYLRWCEGVAKGLNMPICGWQISIGHMGLPNKTVDSYTDNAYEDTFFPYFFTHVKEFIDIGFIGFLVGKGLREDCDFSNETEGEVADRGWFFNNLKQFDKGRPYLNATAITTPQKTAARLSVTTLGQGTEQALRVEGMKSGYLTVELFTLDGSLVKTIYDAEVKQATLQLPIASSNMAHGMFTIRISNEGVIRTVLLNMSIR
ncbi:MAG: hypothetical protein JW795_19095 [Chitinivibrionales bacterium]|nr:hypothetical protein [Chitinivibrionales bacterium]